MYYLQQFWEARWEVTASWRAGQTWCWESKPLNLPTRPVAYAPLNNSGEHPKTPRDRLGYQDEDLWSVSRPRFEGDIVAPSRLIFHFPVPFARPILLGYELDESRPNIEKVKVDKHLLFQTPPLDISQFVKFRGIAKIFSMTEFPWKGRTIRNEFLKRSPRKISSFATLGNF